MPKSNRTVWFAVLSTALLVICFTPSTTPNGALFGDYSFIRMSPAQLSAAEQLSAGVAPSGLRISLGIEHIDDIKADITQALGA